MNNKLSILIVDDDLNIGETLGDILAIKGHEVVFSTSGGEALNHIKEKKFDAVLMDIRMPGMNGVDTLKEIKKYSPLASVVMMTACAEDKLVEQSIIEGALKVLKKPLDIDRIIMFLEKLRGLKTILIVDDDKIFCNALQEYFQKHSYKTILAHNVQKAIEAYNNEETATLLIDLKLNGDNGLEVVDAIKEKADKSSIILMTGFAEQFQPLIDETLKEKVAHFITKPFHFDKVLEILEDIKRRRLLEVI